MGRPDCYHYLVLLGMDIDYEQSLATISRHGEDTEDLTKNQKDGIATEHEIDDITHDCV